MNLQVIKSGLEAPGLATFLVFTNPGELDPRLIQLSGASTKPQAATGAAIGRFGTGIKYAIAGVLRLGGQITIWSGTTEIKFFSIEETIRGQKFRTVHQTQGPEASQTRLGFTLDLGKHWEPWMLYRELWANAKDEGGLGGETCQAAEGRPGQTLVVVDCPELLAVHAHRGEYFLASTPEWANTELEVHPGPSKWGFYQGIRVCKFERPASRTYNVLGTLELTEDRTAQEYWIKHRVAQALITSASEEVLVDMALPDKGSWEEGLDWGSTWATPSQEFLAVAKRVHALHPGTIQESFWRIAEIRLPKEPPQEVSLRIIEQKILTKAISALARHGYRLEAPVRVMESLGDQWLAGMVGDGKEIWLARAAFGKGTKFVAGTLLEEHLHITQGLKDESRKMQDWLMDKIVSLMEEADGEPF